MKEAAYFVYSTRVPETAGVRRLGKSHVQPLRTFPELAEAARAAAEGRSLPAVDHLQGEAEDLLDTPGRRLAESLVGLLWGGGLVGFSIWGLSVGQIPIVGGGRGNAVTIGGGGLWIMFTANMLLASSAFLTVAGHMSSAIRVRCKRAAKWLGVLGVVLLITGIVLGLNHSRLA
jgi:hypothetical protein